MALLSTICLINFTGVILQAVSGTSDIRQGKGMAKKELVILGFMTFALFVGAGNIIFPPFIGLRAGGDL